MNVVILEDELPAFNKLKKLLKEVLTNVNIVEHFDSVSDALNWFQNSNSADLVFMDIHLADGSAFDLLKQCEIKIPIIFTTAYDQYALEAFKTASISYLLKPVKIEDLKNAITKLSDLKTHLGDDNSSEKILDSLKQTKYKSRFLIRFGDTIKSIQTEDVAYFFSENKATYIKTHGGRTYPIDNNLDSLIQTLDPELFFRINRQYIVSLNAINDMKTYSKARVLVKLKPEVKEPPLVSSERSASFKQWLAGEIDS